MKKKENTSFSRYDPLGVKQFMRLRLEFSQLNNMIH